MNGAKQSHLIYPHDEVYCKKLGSFHEITFHLRGTTVNNASVVSPSLPERQASS